MDCCFLFFWRVFAKKAAAVANSVSIGRMMVDGNSGMTMIVPSVIVYGIGFAFESLSSTSSRWSIALPVDFLNVIVANTPLPLMPGASPTQKHSRFIKPCVSLCASVKLTRYQNVRAPPVFSMDPSVTVVPFRMFVWIVYF
jgi:hypothetical protein